MFFVFSQAVYADSLSYSARTAPDYRSDSCSYYHSFSDAYGLSLGYYTDMLASSYNSMSLSLNVNLDENRTLYFSGNSYVSKDLYASSTAGIQYSSMIMLESDAETPVLQPNYYVAMNLSNNQYVKAKLSNTVGDVLLGLGTSIYDNWYISASFDQYLYSNEDKVKDESSVVHLPGSSTYISTSSSPKNILSGTFKYYFTKFFSVYYLASTINDLQGYPTGSATTGISWAFFDGLTLDANTETSSGIVYSSASASYSF